MADPRAPKDPREIDFDLLELERADAVLSGRDPAQADEVVQARVAAEAERQRRQERLDAVQKARRRRRRRTQTKVALVIVVMGMAAGTGFLLSRSAGEEKRHRDAVLPGLEQRGAGFDEHGFTTAGEWLDLPPNGRSIDIPADTCSVLVGSLEGSDADPVLKVRRKGGEVSGSRGLLFCTCDGEQVHVQVEQQNTGAGRLGLRWLSVPASRVGGFEALKTRKLPRITIPDDRVGTVCSDRAFEAWMSGHQKEELDPTLTTPKSNLLQMVAEGWAPIGTFPSEKPFAVVSVPKGQCLAAAVEGEAAEFTIRAADNTKVATTSSSIAVCAYQSDRWFSLWRTKTPSSPVSIVRAQADRIGGLFGAQAMLRRIWPEFPGGVVHPDDLAADAFAVLRAASVPEPGIVRAEASGLPGKVASRLISMTLIDDGSYYPDLGINSPHSCRPELPASESPRALLCVQSKAQKWNLEGLRGKQAAAEAPLPFWLGLYADFDDRGAREAALAMLTFALRMGSLRFDPTTIEGVVDQANGARVAWRQGKGEVVAVGLTRLKPYILPLSLDGSPWSLDGKVPIAKVAQGKSLTLVTRGSLGNDKNARRVVVFRR